jgi:hypothetical protein
MVVFSLKVRVGGVCSVDGPQSGLGASKSVRNEPSTRRGDHAHVLGRFVGFVSHHVSAPVVYRPLAGNSRLNFASTTQHFTARQAPSTTNQIHDADQPFSTTLLVANAGASPLGLARPPRRHRFHSAISSDVESPWCQSAVQSGAR